MFTTLTKILGLLIILLALGGCTPDVAIPATLPPTRTTATTETGTAVAQILVTAVPITTAPTTTVITTLDPNQTTDLQTIERAPSTPVPTNTPRPTFTPSPTPTPAFFDLPEWVADPAVNVLLLSTADMRGRNNAVTLFNAMTGERFDIPVSERLFPEWVKTDDGLYIDFGDSLFADAPPLTVHKINVLTEQIYQYASPVNITSNARHFASPDGRYQVRVVEDENIPAVATLINQETGEEVELADPFNGEYADGTNVAWSFDGQIVAIERFRRVEDPAEFYGVRAEPALAVFSQDGTLLTQYNNLEHTGLKWSPTLPYHLLYPAYDLNEGPPCILDVLAGDYSCVETVAQWRDEQEVEIGVFNWSPDGSKVGFVYWSGTSGFCYVELATEAITCPVTRDDLQIEAYLERFGMEDGVAYLNIRNYEWSPDSQFIALTVAPAPPPSDDGMGATVAVAEISGENLRVIVDGSLPYYNPWRPPIPSLLEE